MLKAKSKKSLGLFLAAATLVFTIGGYFYTHVDWVAPLADSQSVFSEKQHLVFYYLILATSILTVAIAVLGFAIKAIHTGREDKKIKTYMSDLIDVIPDAIISIDRHGHIAKVNSQACQLFGYSEAEFKKITIEAIIPPRFRAAHKGYRAKYFNTPTAVPMKQRTPLLALTKSNHEVPVEISLSFMQQEGNSIAIATIRDISDRIEADNKNRQTAAVFDNTDEGIVIADANKNVLAINKAFTSITGYDLEDVQDRPSLAHFQRENSEEVFAQLQQSLRDHGKWRGELWGRRKSTERYAAWFNISEVKDQTGTVINYIAAFSDISPIKETQEWLTHLAHHDELTQLPNRNYFTENLQQALASAKRHGRRVALLFLDLDRFKIINDTLGHASGDKLLQLVAERLKRSVRLEDTVSRIGGDEFTVILREINHSDDVARVANKIIQQLSLPIVINSREVVTSTSVGISLFPDDADNAENLIKAADSAMYQAKERGRNNYQFYSSELTHEAFEKLFLEQGMRQALKNHEFVLHYQPVISLLSGEMVGVEALIRWQHPQMGLIGPQKFIPIAEETGLIRPIGEWVIQTACAQARHWKEQGLQPLRMAVNISARQMLDEASLLQLEEVIKGVHLRKYGLHVDLEITESDLRIAEHSVETLVRLKNQGVGLAIDDFGTGYSSLSRLKHLPIDTLKIDRSFVKDIPRDKDDEAIASAVISMGRSLNLKVIGEGVETHEQLQFLKIQGCDEIQGFLFSPPVTAAGIVQIIADHKNKKRSFVA